MSEFKKLQLRQKCRLRRICYTPIDIFMYVTFLSLANIFIIGNIFRKNSTSFMKGHISKKNKNNEKYYLYILRFGLISKIRFHYFSEFIRGGTFTRGFKYIMGILITIIQSYIFFVGSYFIHQIQ